ncbi:MAG: hypothetical protein M1814_000602 [Vezdaea aestivalis]|nr:MAG: hypothetical protein M1814_000602 [Vezdaea aestivalis]
MLNSNSTPASHFHNPSPHTLSLADEAALDLWSHAVLLFHQFEWFDSCDYHLDLLQLEDQNLIPLAHIHFNLGIIHLHLGLHDKAYTWLTTAINHEPNLLPAWFALGTLTFEWHNFRQARNRFKSAFKIIADMHTPHHNPEHPDAPSQSSGLSSFSISYSNQGLCWTVHADSVYDNMMACQAWKLWAEGQDVPGEVNLPIPLHAFLRRMPAGLIFEPLALATAPTFRPLFGTDGNADGSRGHGAQILPTKVFDSALPFPSSAHTNNADEIKAKVPSANKALRMPIPRRPVPLIQGTSSHSLTSTNNQPKVGFADKDPNKADIIDLARQRTNYSTTPYEPTHVPASTSRPNLSRPETSKSLANTRGQPQSASVSSFDFFTGTAS